VGEQLVPARLLRKDLARGDLIDGGDLGQQTRLGGDADEAAVLQPHFGEGHRRYWLAGQNQRGIDRQLRLADARLAPTGLADAAAGLVVEDYAAAVVEFVDAIHHQAHGDAFDLHVAPFFAGDHTEGQRPLRFDIQPGVHQVQQPLPLQREKARRERLLQRRIECQQALLDGQRYRLLPGRPHHRLQVARAAPLPEALQHGVQQCAARCHVEPVHRRFERPRAEAIAVESPGRADRLGAQQAGAAAQGFALGHGRRLRVFDALQRDAASEGFDQAGMEEIGCGRLYCRDQRTRAQLAPALAARPGEAHLRRAAQQSPLYDSGERALDLGGGAGRPRAALQLGRQQRIGAGRRRPQVVVHAHRPERVEGGVGDFEQAHHLHRRIARRRRLEDALAAQLGEAAAGFGEAHPAQHGVELRQAVQRLVIGAAGLVFVAGEAALAGPAGGLQQPPEGQRPGRWRLARRLPGQHCLESIQVGQQPRYDQALLRRLLREAQRPFEREGRREEFAHPRIQPGAAVGLADIRGPIGLAQQRGELFLDDAARLGGQH